MNTARPQDDRGKDPLDVLARPARTPDLVLRYGEDTDHVADVHLPPPGAAERAAGAGHALFTIFLHGGFWRAEYGKEHTRPLAEALAARGFVVCAPEYRRTGQAGGGWPGMFDDVAAAVDRLPGLVAEATGGLVDPEQAVLAGHSAGGQLALWAAARQLLPVGSPWWTEGHGARGVVALAAVSDLLTCHRRGLGANAVDALLGGGPAEYPDRYLDTDPLRLVPAGIPVRLVHGMADDTVPYEMSLSYAAQTRAAGVGASAAVCVLLPGAGHFDVIDPLSQEWPQVVKAFLRVAE